MKWISRVLAPHARTYAALAAIFLTGLSTDTFALAKPITAYQGIAGETSIEGILIHDRQRDGMSGYFISSGSGTTTEPGEKGQS